MLTAALVGLLLGAGQRLPGQEGAASSYKAGIAVKVITPPEGLWMAGYAGRKKPADGKIHDLKVKALALEDGKGANLVLLTSDLLGLPRQVADEIAEEVMKKSDLRREQIMLTSSHTHTGPVLHSSLNDMYDLPPEQPKLIAAYTEQLKPAIVQTILAALKDLKPARLSIGVGKAGFVMNRRQTTDKGVVLGVNPKGPVDPEVPVLRVETPDGQLKAVVFGYACHNTTLDFTKWCGDYAGFAQAMIETSHPGAVAMFWIGCGGDANPQPRGKLEMAEAHGRELADAVEAVLKGDLKSLQGRFSAQYEKIALPLDDQGNKEQLAARLDKELTSKDHAIKTRAARLKKMLDTDGQIPDNYAHYPIQLWRIGDNLLWIALGGEVVVEYALHLKKDLAGAKNGTVWVTGYANDVMGYIPTKTMLKEGGYEPDYSMVYYGFPGKWAPTVEEKILAKTRAMANPNGGKSTNLKTPFEKRTFTDPNKKTLPYCLLKPDNYDPKTKYPLVLFLHGAGERGYDNEKQLVHGVMEFAKDDVRKKYPCFVVAPQCPENQKWCDVDWGAAKHDMPKKPSESMRLTLELLTALQKEFSIDPNRLYVTGLSMGGYGTWDAISRHPDLFAAAVPVCGGGDEKLAEKIAKVPIWVFHGGKDETVMPARSRNMVEALKKAGGKPKYTEYPDIGHDSWVPAYKDTDMHAWLFAQKHS
jgi:poly(3-hydroxybutyrate) depolymerase